jgi:hypothetical protein
MKHHAFDFVGAAIATRVDARRRSVRSRPEPSMIPRPGVLQRVEAGIAFALLYGVGTGARALWSWLELPVAGDPIPALFSGCRSLCAWPLSATARTRDGLAERHPSGDGHAGCHCRPSGSHRNRERSRRPVSYRPHQAKDLVAAADESEG